VKSITRQGYCAKGIRKWFETNDLDWQDFLKNGIDESKVLKINDAMSNKLVNEVRNLNRESNGI